MSKTNVTMTVNGASHTVEVEPRELLIHVLREKLNLTGPHIGCENQPLRGLHRRSERQVGEVLHHVRRAGGRQRHHHDRRHGNA